MVELPLTAQTGYGPFGISYCVTHSANNSTDIAKLIKQPEGLTDLQYGEIDTNILQTTYQDYMAGRINKNAYIEMQKAWKWIPDTTALSKIPVKTKVVLAYGKDNEGNIKVVLDANNNMNLTDDKIFAPAILESGVKNADSLAQSHAVNVTFETYMQNKIVSVQIPVLMVYSSDKNLVLYSLSQHYITQYKGKQIAVNSNYGTDISFTNFELTGLTEPGKKATGDDLLKKNEYITLNNESYKITGVNSSTLTLILEKNKLPLSQINSTQAGSKPYPFSGKDVLTQKPVSLESLKGKYVLLDFWGVWCNACIKKMPHLKELYGRVDKNLFEIVGIAEKSTAESVKKLMGKMGIQWPQILSTDENDIVELYGINAFPTTLLLDKKGVIIAKNLHGKELEEKVMKLLNE